MGKICLYFGSLFLCLGIVFSYTLYSYFFYPVGRIDLTTPKELGKTFDVYSVENRTAYIPKETKINRYPDWMKNDKLYGRIYETDAKEAHLDIHVYKPCEIKLRFLGNDAQDLKGRRLNPKVKFTSIKINNQEILKASKVVWHDNSFYYTIPVEPGRVTLDAMWKHPCNCD